MGMSEDICCRLFCSKDPITSNNVMEAAAMLAQYNRESPVFLDQFSPVGAVC